jgi:hypothetical protein
MKTLITLSVLALVFAFATPAHAISFDLKDSTCCAPAGTIYGVVTLLQNGTTVDFTVHLNSPFQFAKTGAVDSQTFLFNGSGVALGDITVDAHIPGLVAAAGSFSASGIGTYGFAIGCPTCGGGLSSGFSNDIGFHVANSVIGDFTGGSQDIFVADIGNPTTGATGPVGAQSVPEPTSLLLLGTSLASLGMFYRRKK